MIKRTYTFAEAQKIIGFIIKNHMYYEIPEDVDIYGPTVDIYMESFNWITVDNFLARIIVSSRFNDPWESQFNIEE